MKTQKKLAVILFNLGAPDHLKSVRPFLRNLFLDPAIIRLPILLRFPLALIISTLRTPIAKNIYRSLGNKSPLLENTEKQAQLLEQKLNKKTNWNVKVFIAMRYWHPMSKEVVEKVKAWSPDKILLAPLYPQFSSATTQSSLNRWKKFAEKKKLVCDTKILCCYPNEEGFITSIVNNIRESLKNQEIFSHTEKFRLLFSAHGIPKNFVELGDPYEFQIQETANAILEQLEDYLYGDYCVCYQSRVGPTKWLQPYLENEIKRAGAEKRRILIVPIAFVSEHSETLYELDREYSEYAIKSGVPVYIRAPTVNLAAPFISGLAQAILTRAFKKPQLQTSSHISRRICPLEFTDCPCELKSYDR